MTDHKTAACRNSGLAVAAFTLFLTPALSATASPPPLPLTTGSFRDMQLTVQARRVLAEDPALAPLNLGVRVRRGVATLWGPVPSADLLQKAVRKLGQVRGIFQVRSEETLLVPMPPRVEPPRLPLKREPPTHTQSASPDPFSGSLGTLTGRGPRPEPPPKEPAGYGSPAEVSPRGSVALRAPQAVAGDLPAAVERLRRGDRRFRFVHVEVRGGTVLLRAGDAGPEGVMAFAQELSRLPGVARVVVQSDPDAPRR